MANLENKNIIDDFVKFRNWDIDTNTWKLATPSWIPKRPAEFNKYGKEITVGLNTYNVLSYTSKPVHQYDVSLLPSTEISMHLH
jgi:hypothetical protein